MSGAVRRRPAWIVCLVAASSTLIGADQQPQRYNETVDVASVLIDVRVLDDAGRPIAALNAGDFSVKIGGKPVRVQSSTWIGVETASPAAFDHVAAPSAVHEGAASRLIVLLFQRSLANDHAHGLLRRLEESRDLMRGLGPSDRVAVLNRGTSRQINRQIALTLISSHQPISRADLARRMKMRRGAIGLLVQALLDDRHIVEGATGQAARGRKPTLLYINTRQRSSVAVDIRASRTFLMLADPMGRPRSDIVSLPTVREPRRLVTVLAARIRQLLAAHAADAGKCEGISLVVPGMVDPGTGRVLHAPTLGWRNVDLRGRLAAATALPVHVENSGRACALAQVWEARTVASPVRNLVFVSVSDGVGVGIVVNGELLRGRHNIAGEFAHMPMSIDGPRCSCGAIGCWEAHISNLATLTRYFGRAPTGADRAFTIDDLVARARTGDGKAVAALQASARYLGLGLGGVVNIINPDCVFIGGEMVAAWDLIESTVRAALAERALTPAAASTDIVIVSAEEHPRLRGAAMLVAAPTFAAPVVA